MVGEAAIVQGRASAIVQVGVGAAATAAAAATGVEF